MRTTEDDWKKGNAPVDIDGLPIKEETIENAIAPGSCMHPIKYRSIGNRIICAKCAVVLALIKDDETQEMLPQDSHWYEKRLKE